MAKIKCICVTCGKEFCKTEAQIRKREGKYCSKECRIAKKGKIECTCIRCGKKFLRYPSDIKVGGGKYCSADCQHKGLVKSDVKKEAYKENNWVKIPCKNCGKLFYVPLHKLKRKNRGKYCSIKCMTEKFSEVKRKPIIKENYALIPLTRNKFAVIDLEDVEKVEKYNWQAKERKRGWYAERYQNINHRKTIIQMHRFIMNCPNDMEVDHIDPNLTLDNRKHNLRICTRSENSRNRRAKENKKDVKYKGVYKRKSGRYRASIRIDGVLTHLGTFESDIEAAKEYDKRAIEVFGEFAYTNF